LRGRVWLVAVILFVLPVQPSSGLEIGNASVTSKQGEPLEATVPILLVPGEQIETDCLSVASRSTATDSDSALLDNANLTLLGKQGPIRITTSAPVYQPAVSLALQVQCAGDPAVVRTVDLYLKSASSSATFAINPALTGTTVTVRPGDSIYGLARLIYPHNETAVRNLAHAIVLANPVRFPDGRARPLQIGERLTIPDLRTVQQIISAAPQPDSQGTRQRSEFKTVATGTRQKPGSGPAPRKPSTPAKQSAPAAAPEHTVLASGKLRLKLATSLDLSRVGTATPGKQMAPRQEADTATLTGSGMKSSLQISTISSRIDQLLGLQDDLNARLARLEVNATALKKALVHSEALRLSLPPSSSQPAVSQPLAASPPQTAVVANRRTTMLTWQWLIIGALSVIMVLAALLLVRVIRKQRALSGHRRRIDAMLIEARTAATPLLGTEPALATRTVDTRAKSSAPISEVAREYGSEDYYDLGKEMDTSGLDETVPSASVPDEPWLDADTTAIGFDTEPSASDEVPARLRLEMDEAMDSTRSMFSDVDRFITLGRVENAISLLEFQIKRNPTVRSAWIKLLAIYRDRGLDGNFDRTYAAFRDQFGNSLGY